MKAIILYIILILIIISCDLKDDINCFVPSNKISKEDFLNVTDRRSIKSLQLRNYAIRFPNNHGMNYYILYNHIINDTIFIKARDRMTKTESILRLKNDKNYQVLSETKIPVIGGWSIRNYYSSPNFKRIAVNYYKGKQSRLIIYDESVNKILEKQHNEQIYMYQNPWSNDGNNLVFCNSKKEIFVVDIDLGISNKIDAHGSKTMWLQGYKKLSYIKENSVMIFDLKRKKNYMIYNFGKNGVSNQSFLDYYWFTNQEILLVKYRSYIKPFENITWSDKEIILKYSCE